LSKQLQNHPRAQEKAKQREICKARFGAYKKTIALTRTLWVNFTPLVENLISF